MKNTVLITGASKGIGFALAQKFLQHNYYVIGTSQSGKIENLTHLGFNAISLNLSNAESIKNAVQAISKNNTSIDILINNVGVGPDLGSFFPEEESFAKTFEINATGTVFFTEQIIDLINKDSGKIINISSKMGSLNNCVRTDSTAYRMSKAALNMYTKIIYNRLQPNYKIAALHPGWVQTTISKGNVNAPLTAEESAKRIFDFVTSNFENGIFWDVEAQIKLEW